MNKLRMYACVPLVLLVVIISLSGCAKQFDDEQLRDQTEVLLNSLIDSNYVGFRENIANEIDNLSVTTGYNELRPMVSGIESYELRLVSRNTQIRNGIQQTSIRYLMVTEKGNFYVDSARVSEIDGVVSFVITPIPQIQTTGTLGSMKGANWVQWGLLLIGMAEILFVIWMFVDCVCHKFKGKGVWIAIILLCSVIVSVTLADGTFGIHFNVGFFVTHTAWLQYSTGGSTIRIMLPVGSVLYLLSRKKLHSPVEKKDPVSIPDVEITDT